MLQINPTAVQRAMLTSGLTLSELATRAKISRSRLSSISSRNSRANYPLISRLATALNVAPESLILELEERND